MSTVKPFSADVAATTDRVAELMSLGLNNKDIAARIGMKPNSVGRYVKRIVAELGGQAV